ncbi:alpha/beta fold hydrolase [Hymenobacter sp. BT683]|uniref:Alpha/beta fold hydrolase n=1 Tax=Hymenobacter jeongseonensis TaxID=2791027 RepID=A0ABS0IEX6_9BACT|nr:alpha/beta hydrolase [Hymenobacter jeongseonensis]MBF9236916.1 alpha/beta fold hydrolase [Hymenobacter jeongseonensis]
MVRFLLLCLTLLAAAPAFAIRPVAAWWATPDTLGLKYRQVEMTTPDRVKLVAWLIEPSAQATDQHTTVVVAGGDSYNMSSNIYTARALAEAGYGSLLFDYRGFGHSQAVVLDRQRLYYEEFAIDLRTALAEARRLQPRDRVGILGLSMGALVGSEVAARAKPDFLVTEGYPGDLPGVVAYQKAAFNKTVTLPAEAAAYPRVAARVRCPWLLIAGIQDKNTPLADSAAVVQGARRSQRRQLLAIDCGHLGAQEKLTETFFAEGYVRAIGRFLAGGKA